MGDVGREFDQRANGVLGTCQTNSLQPQRNGEQKHRGGGFEIIADEMAPVAASVISTFISKARSRSARQAAKATLIPETMAAAMANTATGQVTAPAIK